MICQQRLSYMQMFLYRFLLRMGVQGINGEKKGKERKSSSAAPVHQLRGWRKLDSLSTPLKDERCSRYKTVDMRQRGNR